MLCGGVLTGSRTHVPICGFAIAQFLMSERIPCLLKRWHMCMLAEDPNQAPQDSNKRVPHPSWLNGSCSGLIP